MKIPRIIDEQEILVRFVFEKHFKKKKIVVDKIIDSEIFLDLRGVSLLREFYCNEDKCKTIAKQNSTQKYIGFVVFRLDIFNSCLKKHKIKRPNFEAKLKSTPLDLNLNLIPRDIEITTSTPGMPAHADIEYINPAVIEDETPKIAIRKFSRSLFKDCKLLIDSKIDEDSFLDCKFRDVI